jgi:hypothetical protein
MGMRRAWLLIALAAAPAFAAVTLDQIAVIVDDQAVKDSDIRREIRTTAFLNGASLQFSLETRKKALDRLISQALIRREIEVGQYPFATEPEVDRFLEQVKLQRFKSQPEYQQALRDYGLTEEQLRRALKWQLTVLNFIQSRFRPGVFIKDEDVKQYYASHLAELTAANGGKRPSLEEARDEIEKQITAERVNQNFNEWLDQLRRNTVVKYREVELR